MKHPTRQELKDKKESSEIGYLIGMFFFFIVAILMGIAYHNSNTQNTNLQSQLNESRQNELCHYVNQTGDYNMTCEDALKIPPSPISYSPNKYLYDCHSLNDGSLVMICKVNLSEVLPQ